MLNKIRSSYVALIVFNNIQEGLFLKLIKYNKKLQFRLNKSLENYKEYNNVEIEIIPTKGFRDKDIFINIKNEDINNISIYFDDKLVNRNYFTEDEKISKIKINMNIKTKSLKELFSFCDCIKEITFLKFKLFKINDMRDMFYHCRNLIKITFNEFYTSNVIDMSGMFCWCTSLKVLDLSKFNTINVNNMSDMFYQCTSLEKLNLSTFNTENVRFMYSMFNNCSSLVELNLSEFKIPKVINMNEMFSNCSKLKVLNICNFVTSIQKIYNIFNKCKLNTIYFHNQKMININNIKNFEDLLKLANIENNQNSIL